MVINVHRIKREVSGKKTTLAEDLAQVFNNLFLINSNKRSLLKRKVRTAMIMY